MMRKLFTILLLCILPFVLSAQEGRWYSLDEESHISSFFEVLMIIVAIIACILFSPALLDIFKKDTDKDSKQFGCMVAGLIIAIILVIVTRCGNK